MAWQDEKLVELEKRLDLIEFRQQLLFDNDEVSRLLFEYGITHEQYRKIMGLMDEYRQQIANNQEVSHGAFEEAIYKIVPEHASDYHMCEYLARAFMEVGRWDEVFPALYGKMAKYQYMMEKNNE